MAMTEARRAVYNNRARLRSGVAKEAFKRRAELVERSFALTLDRGGMRRSWLRGRENLHKRYLVHVAGYNLGLIMRLLIGAGTPREFLAGVSAHLMLLTTADDTLTGILDRCHRHRSRDARRPLRAGPARLKPGFVNALLRRSARLRPEYRRRAARPR